MIGIRCIYVDDCKSEEIYSEIDPCLKAGVEYIFNDKRYMIQKVEFNHSFRVQRIYLVSIVFVFSDTSDLIKE